MYIKLSDGELSVELRSLMLPIWWYPSMVIIHDHFFSALEYKRIRLGTFYTGMIDAYLSMLNWNAGGT